MAIPPAVTPTDLHSFIRDWLRHAGRSQADLRRALQASSPRMPVLLDTLQHIQDTQGLAGLAARLCGIEELWRGEDGWQEGCAVDDSARGSGLEASFSQLDLLLKEIRMDRGA